MGGNGFFFAHGDFHRDAPRRLFATVDRRENGRIQLEAVDAFWTEANLGRNMGFADWSERAPDAPLFIIEMPDRVYGQWRPLPSGEDKSESKPQRTGPGRRWLEVEVAQSGAGNALLYSNLFAEGRSLPVAVIRPAPIVVARELDLMFRLDDFVADEEDIRAALKGLQQTIHWIAVYDVGQGSANGLCSRDGAPVAYFDLGGGVLDNAGTFPPALTNICTTYQPPVILSHWDWDHWSSAQRFQQALRMSWIVPNQELGVVHGAFAADVVANGRLLVWPDGLAGMHVGKVTVEKCTGAGRNHSGLALLVDGPNAEPPILLPGDARYSAIPSGFAEFTSVVVPHHGADMRLKATPVCPRLAASRAAYSFGKGNSYSHPRDPTLRDHHANSWDHSVFQPGGGGIDRQTAQRTVKGLGHIGLDWSGATALPQLPCGGQWSLALQHR